MRVFKRVFPIYVVLRTINFADGVEARKSESAKVLSRAHSSFLKSRNHCERNADPLMLNDFQGSVFKYGG